MALVRVRRSRKASTSERVMRSPMRVPNLLAFSSGGQDQPSAHSGWPRQWRPGAHRSGPAPSSRPHVRHHQRCSISHQATHASQNTAITAPVVTTASTSSRGADVGRDGVAWPSPRTTKVRGQIATTTANSSRGVGRVQLMCGRVSNGERGTRGQEMCQVWHLTADPGGPERNRQKRGSPGPNRQRRLRGIAGVKAAINAEEQGTRLAERHMACARKAPRCGISHVSANHALRV